VRRALAIVVAVGIGHDGCSVSFSPNDRGAILAIAREYPSYGDVDEPEHRDPER
jgi:hypothetical protein